MPTSCLADQECIPCKGGVTPLKGADLQKLADQLQGWDVVREHHLSKIYPFPNFASALVFTTRLGELAERVGHHPDIHLSWGRVGVEIWTHKIDGLTESDFIWAAKADKLLNEELGIKN
jgi:4a-hydroxytetrahydrobiopterin dehydratase